MASVCVAAAHIWLTLRFTVEILQRWKQRAEERARKALETPRIANAGADFDDTILLVTTHKEYPAFPESVLKGPRRMRRVTYDRVKGHRNLIDIQFPIVGGPPPGPPGFGTIILSCQNQGTGVDQFVRFGLTFHGKSAIHRTDIKNERVFLNEGGSPGSSYVTFMVREILPRENMRASLVARNDLPFDAHLWTERTGDSPEVLVYDVIIGEEEVPPSISPPSEATVGS